MTTYRHTATGATVTLPGRRQTVGGVSLTGQEDAATMAALGFEALPPATPPEPPTLDELRAARLAAVRMEADATIRANVPAPWDSLRDVATAEYREWMDEYRAAVAAELARLETAIAGATDAEALAAIVADWPEVAE